MSGYIKYFENGGKNMSFLIKDDEVWEKYEQIWDVIKNKLGIKFHSEPVYEYRYLKAKVDSEKVGARVDNELLTKLEKSVFD